MQNLSFNGSYSGIGDIVVIVLCLTLFIVIGKSFIKNQYSFVLFKLTTVLLILCSFSNIMIHANFDLASAVGRIAICTFKDIRCITSSLILISFILYVEGLVKKGISARLNNFLSKSFLAFVAISMLTSLLRISSSVDGVNVLCDYVDRSMYILPYIMYTSVIAYMFAKYRNSMPKQVYFCLLQIFVLAYSIMILQSLWGTSSLMTTTFLLPLLSVLFLVHSNPYDIETGALDSDSFFILLDSCIEKKMSDIVLLSINITDLSEKMEDKNISSKLFRFYDNYISNGSLFRLSESRLVLMFEKSKNENYSSALTAMCSFISDLQLEFGIDYKIVEFESLSDVLNSKGYLSLIEFVEGIQKNNTAYYVTEDDIKRFNIEQCIETELREIVNAGNLDDDRVVVVCQPIFDVKTGQFRTAEALMRFNSHSLGMVYPDVFIPVAERINCIHFLSLIIFNKVCKIIKQLDEEGYVLDRISVNFSIIELQSSKFCNDIISIVKMNNIEFSKVAIELTESMNDSDYEYMRARISSLRNLGICFYLDDFGTGYSNFDRILKLPVDIIKFDRSLLLLSSQDTSYKSLIENFVSIFKTLNFSVLFEGVEDDEAENYCKYAQADYLQGYKYSKPIPIDNLRSFLSHK